MAISSKTVCRPHLKESGITMVGCPLHRQFARTAAVLPYYWFEYNQKGNQENGYIILLFLEWNCLARRSESGVKVGVGVDIFRPESESELESLEIRRLCSPA